MLLPLMFAPPNSRRWLQAGLYAALWLALTFFYARDQQFPYYYHTDEPAKADQVLTGSRNFNHPELLLNTADFFSRLMGKHGSRQQIAEVGRCCSAGFAALAIVLAAWVAGRQFAGKIGWLAAAGSVLVSGLHPLLYELAHYFKEDTALLGGLLLVLAAVSVFETAPALPAVALLGVAAGVSFSAKYIGGVAAGLALLPLLLVPLPAGSSRRKWIAAFLGTLALTFLLLNFQVLGQPAAPLERITDEVSKLSSKPRGLDTGRIQWTQLGDFWKSWPGWIWTVVLAWFVLLLRKWRAASWSVRLGVVFFGIYLLLLAFTPRVRERYFLPLVVLSGWFFALAACYFLTWLRSRRPQWSIPGFCAVILLFGWQSRASISGIRRLEREFQKDSTMELAGWIRQNLPARAVIASGSRVMLPTVENRWFEAGSTTPPLTQKNPRRSFLADYGSLEQMRQQGVQFVVQDDREWGPYLHDKAPAKGPEREKFEQRKKFYRDLQARSELLWQRKSGKVLYLCPALRLYKLPETGGPA